jgi:hypothetical protein
MADNLDTKVAANVPVATDEVTYSGDAGQHVQLFKSVAVVGAEGSKTPVNVALIDDSAFTPATSAVTPVGFMLDDTATGLVVEGDIGAARMTADRRQIVQLGEAGAKDVVGGGTQTGTSDQSIMAAGGAGVFNYLCWLTLHNSSATNTFATLKDGSTTRAVIPLPAYGGAVLQWPRGLRSTANTAWNVASGASVTTAYFYGGGYTATS